MRFSGWSYVGMLCWLSLPAHSLDLSPDESRILTDPAFLPSAGQLVGATSYEYGTATGNVSDQAGARLYSLNTHTSQLSQSLSYGFTREFSLWGDISRASPTTHYDFATGGHAASGVPETYLQLGVTDRVLDQAIDPFNLDISVALPGRLNIALSREMRDLTIEGSAGLYRGGSGHEFDPVRDTYVHVSKFLGYYFGVQTQTRLTSALSINLGAQYISGNVDDAHASIDGSSFLIHYPDQVKFDLGLNYQLIPNRLVAHLSGTYRLSTTRRDEYPDPTFDLLTRGHGQRGVGVSLIYSFK